MSGTTLHRPVLFRKKKGTLLIDNDTGIKFQVDQDSTLSEEWTWQEITKCMANPASSEKALLKLALVPSNDDGEERKSPTLTFTSREALEEARSRIKACLNGTAHNGDLIAQAAAAANQKNKNGDRRKKKKKKKSTRSVNSDLSESESSMDFSESTIHHLDLPNHNSMEGMDDSRASVASDSNPKKQKKKMSKRNVMADDSEASDMEGSRRSVTAEGKPKKKKKSSRKLNTADGSERGLDESQTSLAADGTKKPRKKKSTIGDVTNLDESQKSLAAADGIKKPNKKPSQRDLTNKDGGSMDESQTSASKKSPSSRDLKDSSEKRVSSRRMDGSQKRPSDRQLKDSSEKRSSRRRMDESQKSNSKKSPSVRQLKDSSENRTSSRRNVAENHDNDNRATHGRHLPPENPVHLEHPSVGVVTPEKMEPPATNNDVVATRDMGDMDGEAAVAATQMETTTNKGTSALGFVTGTTAGIALAICCCCLCCILLPIIIYVVVSQQAAAALMAAQDTYEDDYWYGANYAEDFYSGGSSGSS